MKAKRKPITRWCNAVSLVKTIHGKFYYHAWCAMEADRQTKLGRPAKVACIKTQKQTICAVVHA